MHKFWVEKHFRTKESLVADINCDILSYFSHHGEGLELSRLLPLAGSVFGLFIVFGKFFNGVLAHVTVGFLDSSRDFL